MSALLDRLLKRSPWRYHHDRHRWERRTYPCARWWCFRRSPAYLSFERDSKSYCIRHVPWHPEEVA
jgi:hypothetical protein